MGQERVERSRLWCEDFETTIFKDDAACGPWQLQMGCDVVVVDGADGDLHLAGGEGMSCISDEQAATADVRKAGDVDPDRCATCRAVLVAENESSFDEQATNAVLAIGTVQTDAVAVLHSHITSGNSARCP